MPATRDTARFVAARPTVPVFGAGLTDLVLLAALLNVFAAEDFADFEALGLLRIFPALWVAALLGVFLLGMRTIVPNFRQRSNS